MCRVYYFYLLPFQVEEAANNWNSASTGIGKKIHWRKQFFNISLHWTEKAPFRSAIVIIRSSILVIFVSRTSGTCGVFRHDLSAATLVSYADAHWGRHGGKIA